MSSTILQLVFCGFLTALGTIKHKDVNNTTWEITRGYGIIHKHPLHSNSTVKLHTATSVNKFQPYITSEKIAVIMLLKTRSSMPTSKTSESRISVSFANFTTEYGYFPHQLLLTKYPVLHAFTHKESSTCIHMKCIS